VGDGFQSHGFTVVGSGTPNLPAIGKRGDRMSLAKSLRSFLIAIPGHSFGQIAQQKIPQHFDPKLGYICYARRNTTPLRTLDLNQGTNEQQFFDVEIYHQNPDSVEVMAELLQTYDCYRGEFGEGTIQALFVDGQTDDYVPLVEMTDTENMMSAFLSFEIRSYRE
jgi:hypothetical protein